MPLASQLLASSSLSAVPCAAWALQRRGYASCVYESVILTLSGTVTVLLDAEGGQQEQGKQEHQ